MSCGRFKKVIKEETHFGRLCVYRTETNKKMKTFLKLTGVLVLLGLWVSSCSKGRLYDDTSWFTETGPGHSITATFSDGCQKCMVLEVSGECGIGCEYPVEWTARNAFNLFLTDIEETNVKQVYYRDIKYSGVINGDTMLLDVYRLDGEAKRTYELKRVSGME